MSMNNAYKTITVTRETGAGISPRNQSMAEKVSNRMDRGFRIYSEGATTNQKVYKESTVLAKVNHNLSNLRPN